LTTQKHEKEDNKKKIGGGRERCARGWCTKEEKGGRSSHEKKPGRTFARVTFVIARARKRKKQARFKEFLNNGKESESGKVWPIRGGRCNKPRTGKVEKNWRALVGRRGGAGTLPDCLEGGEEGNSQ